MSEVDVQVRTITMGMLMRIYEEALKDGIHPDSNIWFTFKDVTTGKSKQIHLNSISCKTYMHKVTKELKGPLLVFEFTDVNPPLDNDEG